MLGSGAVIVMDETTCMVKMLERISEFYYEESCGQCTPCREGTGWLARILHRIEHGEGRDEDLDLLDSVAGSHYGSNDLCVWVMQPRCQCRVLLSIFAMSLFIILNIKNVWWVKFLTITIIRMAQGGGVVFRERASCARS